MAEAPPARRLLLIDDEVVARTLLARRLRQRGYTVTEADGGARGLALLAESAVDLVICDLVMPDVSGQEVLAQLRTNATTADLPLIMLTASGQLDDKIEALGSGADDYLVKPVAIDELALRVERLVSERDRRQAAELAARVAATRAVLLGHVVRLMTEPDPMTVLCRTVEVALRLIPATLGGIIAPTPTGWVCRQVLQDDAWLPLDIPVTWSPPAAGAGVARPRRDEHDQPAWLAALGVEEALIAPLIGTDGQVHAAVAVCRRSAAVSLTAEDETTLVGLCDQAILALEHAELQAAVRASRDAAERRQWQAEQIAGLARALVDSEGVAGVMAAIISRTQALLGATTSTIALLDADGVGLEIVASPDRPTTPKYLPLAALPRTAQALASREPMFLDATTTSDQGRALLVIEGVSRVLVLPLLTHTQPIGALWIGYDADHHPPLIVHEIWRQLAEQCGLAIERARLQERTARALLAEREARAQLTQTAKLAAVGTLAAGVAHELNQPLMIIRGQTQLLLTNGDDPSRRRDKLQRIEHQTERMAAIIDHLRTFGRSSPTDTAEPVDLNQIVQATLLLTSTQFHEREIAIVLDLAAPAPVALANANQVEQIVLNLLTNARDASVAGGELILRTRVDDGTCLLSVIDSGTGIPPEVLSRVFEPFFTTKAVGSGTGLGLSISRQIAQDWHGSLTLANRADRPGAITTLRLPKARATA